VVRQPSVGQQYHLVELAEHAGRRLVDGAYDDLAHARDGSERVDDVRGRVAVQAGGDLVAEQYRRVVQQLDGEGDLLALAARQVRYARVQEPGHAQRGHDAVHVILQSRLGHVTVHFQIGLAERVP